MKKTDFQKHTHREVIESRMRAGGSSDYEVNEMLDSWTETQKLVPKDFDAVQGADVCGFCANAPKKADGYAHTVLAHKEPAAFKSLLGFGKPRYEAEVGSLLPVYIPICPRCRKRFRAVRRIKTLVTLGFILLGAAVALFARDILGAQGNVKAQIIIYCSAAILVIAGFVVSAIVVNRYITRNSGEVHFNIFDIDLIGRMREKGWFLFQDNSTTTAVSFSKDSGDFGRIFDEQPPKTR